VYDWSIFQKELFYTALMQIEYYGLCHLPYANDENYHFIVEGYRRRKYTCDPLGWD
jgi:hypothetical protein